MDSVKADMEAILVKRKAFLQKELKLVNDTKYVFSHVSQKSIIKQIDPTITEQEIDIDCPYMFGNFGKNFQLTVNKMNEIEDWSTDQITFKFMFNPSYVTYKNNPRFRQITYNFCVLVKFV